MVSATVDGGTDIHWRIFGSIETGKGHYRMRHVRGIITKKHIFLFTSVLFGFFSFYNSILPTYMLSSPGAMQSAGFTQIFTWTFIPSIGPKVALLPSTIWSFAFVLAFGILFSRQMSDDFSINGVYGFVRRGKIGVWYGKQIGKLISNAFVFAFLYIGTIALLAFIYTGGVDPPTQTARGLAVFLLLYNLFCATLLLFLTSVAVNLFSIRFGSTVGLVLVYLIVLSLIFVPLLFYDAVNVRMSGASWGFKDTRQNTNYLMPFPMNILFWLNPIVSLIPNWHRSPENFSIYEFQNRPTAFIIDNLPNWDMSGVILLCYALLLIIAGWLFLRRRDISLVNEENR